MSAFNHFLLSLWIIGYIFCSSRAWNVEMPSNIKGLLGSCLVIPCSFDYFQYPPKRPDRVVWYQYVSRGYPLVYDNWYPNSVIDIFKGKTSLHHHTHSKTCSLRIYPVTWSHDRQKIYPWVDPENVGKSTYRFYDTTVTIEVTGTAEKPDLKISGEKKVGQSVEVECSVYHTCPTDPPTLTLSIPKRSHRQTLTMISNGIYKTSLTSMLHIEKDHQTVECTVWNLGGLSATTSKTFNAECSFSTLTISPTSNEFLEGYASKVTCTASYTCPQHLPTFSWNYKSMPASTDTRNIASAKWTTVSTLTFTASATDHGRSLTCYARFTGGGMQEKSITLRVKRNMVSRGWSFTTPGSITGMRGSCIIIPCRFTYTISQPADLRVIWYLYQSNGYPPVFDQTQSVISKFKGITSLIGSVREGNCSLKIERLDMSHNQDRIYPWIDKNPIASFHTRDHMLYDKTTQLIVSDHAQEPQLSISGIPRVGEQSRVSCSVRHTCLPAPPILTLNGQAGDDFPTDTLVSDGIWERTVERTWTVQEGDRSVNCAVSYQGGQTATKELKLNVECPYKEITMVKQPGEATEGVATSVICSVSYTCKKNEPIIVWNFKDMQSSSYTKPLSSYTYETVSNLTFIGSLGDDGKPLTCTAKFLTGETSDSTILHIKRNILSRGWSFTTPGSITGMRGSCIIIPCRFTYTISQPADLRVIWYLYQSNGYPPVFDQTQSVISKFKGITSLIGSVREGNCSLKIERLDMSHNQDRIYPWIDKNPIASFHTRDHMLYDKTTQLTVSDHAQEPQLSISGIPRVGEQSRVSCSVRHTCLPAPPILTLNGQAGDDFPTDTLVSDGIWERTVERTWTVQEGDRSVNCAVSYQGGQTATKELKLNVECPYKEITMVKQPGEAKEGVATSVICSVSYTCKKNEPIIVWNFKDMQSSSYTKPLSSYTYETVSNLTFIGSLGDDGKPLTCTAKFLTGETSYSTILHIKKYVKPVEERDPHENDTTLAADVPFRFTALTRSCVVIPCSFQYEADVILTRGIWSKKSGGVVFHNGQTYVLDHFKGRTRLIGDLSEGNCSLEIDDIKPFDNGPFCFYGERGHEKYRFNNSCVFIIMKASPEKPVMTPVPTEVDAGSTITVSCSVTHTCPSHPPEFSWSVPNLTSEVTHTLTTRGIWETTSTITFMVAEGDGVRSLTCTAIFWRNKQQASTAKLNVKGSLMYQLRSSLPISIPVSALVLTVIILAAVCGVFIWRKRKHSDNSMKPPPRPEKRRSLWDRLSRRYPEDRNRPPRPEKRRSIWSRFSTREEDGRVGWKNERRPRKSFWSRFSRNQGNTPDLSMGYLNNSTTVNCGTQISKQRFPSPKDNRRPAPYGRPQVSSTVDQHVYGNL
ncbi:uncharacterized protein [Trachinotus anak]|uniref:uncharacterized protein isoform X2 n=1 Tax=Trachinotus anak TaxID=443729 RepID=UPI0039F1A7AF